MEKEGLKEGCLKEMLLKELEIGQVSSMIKEIIPAKNIIDEIILEFNSEKQRINSISF